MGGPAGNRCVATRADAYRHRSHRLHLARAQETRRRSFVPRNMRHHASRLAPVHDTDFMAATESRTLHFDLSHLTCDAPLTFHQSLKTYELKRHDHTSRATARAELAILGLIPDDNLTHFVLVEDLPAEQIVLTYVTKRRTVSGRDVDAPIHMGVYVPPAGRDSCAAQIRRARREGHAPRLHPSLARFNVTPESLAAVLGADVDPAFPPHIGSYQDALDAAIALLFHHPNLINLSADNSGAVPSYIIAQHIIPAITATNDLIIEILTEGDNYLVTTAYTGPDGTPATSTVPSATIQQVMTGSLQTALRTSQADIALEGQMWNYEYGTTSAPFNASVQTGVAVVKEQRLGATNADTWTARSIGKTGGLNIDNDSIVVTSPTTGDSWTGNGVWSQNDVVQPFDADMLAALKAGTLTMQIVASDAPAFTLSGQLLLGTEADNGQTNIAVTLAAVGTLGPSQSPVTAVTMSLNSGQTGVIYSITASGLGSSATCALFAGTGAKAVEVCALMLTDYSGMGSITLQCTNTWLRHLSAFVQYLDSDGNALTPPQWSENLPNFLTKNFESDPTKKFLAMVPPVATVFGVPVPATPTTLTFPIWEQVSTVRLLWGGLGRGSYDSSVCAMGIVVTALSELVLPPFLLVAGTAVTNSSTVVNLMKDTEVLCAVCAVGVFLVAGPAAAYIALSQNPGGAATGLTEKFAPMLLSPVTSLGKYIAEQIVEGSAERATPFLDIALLAINAAVTAAELTETIVEVLDSPFVYETDLVATVDMVVTLYPDPRFNKFPDYHDHVTVTVVYDVGTTQPTVTEILPVTTLSDPIIVTFSGVPAGGMAKAYAFFYAEDDWQSGQGVGEWAPVVGTNGSVAFSVTVTTNEVPLTVASVYYHVEKIVNDSGALAWQAALDTPPTATINTASPYIGQQKAVQKYCGMTMTQQAEMIGMGYQAIGLNMPPDVSTASPSNDALYMLQNISVLQNPSLGTSTPAVAFTSTAGTAYNMAASESTTGTNFFIDSSAGVFDAKTNPSGGFHVRSIELTHDSAPTFSTSSNSSYGRFPVQLDRYVLHPQGLVIGINLAASKIYLLTLADTPVADLTAPQATMSSGEGFRDGLISGPRGIAIALDGRVLILESNNNRIQAFDIQGKPVQYFSGGTSATMTLNSASASFYLDIAVESKGYIYVLYYTGDGSLPSDYNVDIYQPDGTFLVSTPNVAAANLVVDILRNMFTLNYETILDGSNRPMPSLSHWMPPAPPAGTKAG